MCDLFDIEQYNKEKNTYNWFNPATYLCHIFVVVFSAVQLFEVVVRFVDIGGIVDHLCLNFSLLEEF